MRKNIGQQNKEDAFIQEVNEELKNEKIRNIWNNYGLYIIAFIVAVLAAAVSLLRRRRETMKTACEFLKTWKKKQEAAFTGSFPSCNAPIFWPSRKKKMKRPPFCRISRFKKTLTNLCMTLP